MPTPRQAVLSNQGCELLGQHVLGRLAGLPKDLLNRHQHDREHVAFDMDVATFLEKGIDSKRVYAFEHCKLISIEIAKQTGGGEHQLASLAPGLKQVSLDAFDDAPAVPHRLYAKQGQSEGDHGAFITDGIGCPENDGLASALLHWPLSRTVGQLATDTPADATRDQATVERMEIAPGR